MDRLIAAPPSDFQVICEAALERDRFFLSAAYPPGCTRSEGRVIFQSHDRPGLTLLVDKTAYTGSIEEVRQLFTDGGANFSTPEALHDFCHGPLAAAFAALGHVEEPAGGAYFVDPSRLSSSLGRAVDGQELPLARVSEIVAHELARTRPTRPASIALVAPDAAVGPAALAALPAALTEQGLPGYEVFEIDCRALASEMNATSIVGVSPGFVGYDPNPPLIQALRQPHPIIVLRDVEHAHIAVLERIFVPLLKHGRINAPNGVPVEAPTAVVACTTTVAYDELADSLDEALRSDRSSVERACRNHLIEHGLPCSFVQAISGFAFFELIDGDTSLAVAEREIKTLASEYGLDVAGVDESVSGAVLDLAEHSGSATALRNAARDLLAKVFADASRDMPGGRLHVTAGPPPTVVAATGRREA